MNIDLIPYLVRLYSMKPALSDRQLSPDPELALLLALLRTPPDADEIDRQCRIVSDWPRVLELAKRHRVISLVVCRLTSAAVPAEIQAEFRRIRDKRCVLGLRQIAEANRLIRRLEAEGIPSVLLKGAGLSMRAYGHPLLRDGRDIDLLIGPESLRLAERVLKAEGLRMVKPREMTAIGRALYRRYAHEYVLTSTTGVVIEVKMRLQPTMALLPIPAADILARRVTVSVAGARLPIPADQDLLPYLCTHGARHCWFRLKWLADIAALLAKGSSVSATAMYAEGERWGGEVSVLEALDLAHNWLGTAIPEEIRAASRAHPLVCRRRALVERAMLELGPGGNPLALPGFEAMIDRSEYFLRGEPGYRLAVLERQSATFAQAMVRRIFGG